MQPPTKNLKLHDLSNDSQVAIFRPNRKKGLVLKKAYTNTAMRIVRVCSFLESYPNIGTEWKPANKRARTHFVNSVHSNELLIVPIVGSQPQNRLEKMSSDIIFSLSNQDCRILLHYSTLYTFFSYRKNPKISTYLYSGLAAEAELVFGDRTYFSGETIKAGANRMQSQTAFHPVLVAH